MNVQSSGESVSIADGAVQIAFDLSSSSAGYLIITKANGDNHHEFFGADHYVEVKDQLFGRYGGIERLLVLTDCAVVVRLSTEVPGVGQEISITTAMPMPRELLKHLQTLERP